MRKEQLKRRMAGIWTAIFVAMGSMTAFAAGDAVTVEGTGTKAEDTKVVIGHQDNDLFSITEDLMPGDTISNTVTLANKSSRTVTIYLKAFSDYSSEDGFTAVRGDSVVSREGKAFHGDLLDQIQMTLKLGDTVIYQGSADGNTPAEGYQTLSAGDYGISLGSFAANQTTDLVITLTLPGPTFDNSFADRFDAVDWVFCVEGTTPGGNSGGGGGDNPSGGGGGDNPPVTIIPDEDVPLTAWTGGEGDSNVLILDEDVPLGALPKMGDDGTYGYVFGILLTLLVACSAVYMKKRLNRS